MILETSDRPLKLVRHVLQTIGYDDGAIVANYDFAVPEGRNALGQVDLAAFSDPVRHDLNTSCIAAQRVSDETEVQAHLETLSYLAVPWALMLDNDYVGVWRVSRMPSLDPVQQVPYDGLSQFFQEHEGDFRPDALTAAKTKGHQTSFFDLDRTLLQFAYETTQDILVNRFETAVSVAKDSLGATTEPLPGDLTKVVLQILTAAVLDDKHLLGDERSSTAEDLMQRSASRYGRYFDVHSLSRIGHSVAQDTFETLRRNVTFRSFTNEMLGYFYENALVDQKLRKELGIHYTPRSIAHRILSRMPIEDIPPSDRVVFDGSCGSGNFLLAAYERLAELLPSAWDRNQKHNHLVKRVHGVDVDPFAAQVAGLSLFFMDLLAGDSWDVKAADFMTSAPASLTRPPTIVVGNPPFEELRSSEGQRRQRATLFLNKYLDVLEPGGLIGMVLPETFLENSSCRDARRRFLEECELLELWHLPEGIFPTSSAATAIVIARKLTSIRNNQGAPVRVERVGGLSREKTRFLNGDRPRFSYVVPSTEPWTRATDVYISSSPLDKPVWDAVRSAKRLGDIAYVRNGIIPGKNQRSDHIETASRGPEWKRWISGSSEFEPYALKPKQIRYVRYPGNLHRPRTDLESVFESPKSKVLVNSGRAPGNPWRIYAAIDDVGCFPSQGIHCVIPKDSSVSLEEITAFLNSSVASAWVDSRNRRRWIGEDTLRDMPFPAFTNLMRETVKDRVTEIAALKGRALQRRSKQRSEIDVIRKLVRSIDELVCEALEVSAEGCDMLNRLFSGYRRPGLEWNSCRPPLEEVASTSNGRKWPVTGQVIEMDAKDNAVTMWVRGYNDSEPFRIPIPDGMPGWALRPEVAFEAEIPRLTRDIDQFPGHDLTNFRPLDFSYSQTDELVELLANPEKLYELYGC